MQIRDFIKESFNDFPGKVPACVVFTPGCNYKCPACHAKHLLEPGKNIYEREVFEYLDSRKDWIHGVVICGGEPTIQNTLIYFIRKLKERNLSVKLDTNGSNYVALGELIGMVDYVAMDVKGPLEIYPNLVGREYIDFRDEVEKAIGVVSQFKDYEFRTTIVPVVRKNGSISFMTPKEIGETAKLIYDCTGSREHKYFLQPFVVPKSGLLDERLEAFLESSKELLEKGKREARRYLPKCGIR